ncbi:MULTISPECIES: sensor histidine kinase [Streptomyces diastaticus group]|uniref:sensor histidine kinase n=1 Tax=Streptomyces diastaticus group TaxID=2849069 RepID=UPI0013CA06B2|nr:nitrate- and nitrite sensing domain-containing protein [Streptomyces rutgersensis]GFH66864.1 histidine kinase [Streptomyces rutgersensis]
MRFRGRTIRRKIVALLLVPLVSLTAIWGFATVLTGREAAEILEIGEADDRVGRPVEEAARVLQDERRRTLVHLADPRASAALGDLRRARTVTDRALARVRAGAEDADATGGLSADSRRRLTALLESFEGITTLRRSVEDNTVTRTAALDLYNRLVDPCFVFLTHLPALKDVALDKQNRALVSVARARDLLSREDALVASALVGERLDKADLRQVSDLLAQRTLLYEISLPLLPDDERARYERYWQGPETAPLRDLETSVAAAAPGPPHGVTAKSWDTAAVKVLDGLAERGSAAADRYEERVRPVAVGILVQAGATAVLGFAALLLSLYLSVRIGRSLIRALSRLRHQAHEASGVRLPSVQRRLAAGEQVDVDTEAPRLEYDKNEIGQVGQALNTLQRAAVEGAVKQAQMRRGVSEVFVNLARRSQVLLHKQLTLLDTMERRTEDSEELADLFRLDHLTTRMRRHAEGLVILSGAAPSRQWRRPVQLMDVVRASVAEVEDYERIEVRRLPKIAVTGPAVADLTHLTAELLENATVFSPPHTAVQVHGESVANGFTLEIHDRGLGMAPDVLLDANLRLAETPDFELSDTDRLGLFVVSRLAQRQNIRVSLQKSPYGGTTAVVFIPDALLIETDGEPSGSTDGRGLALDGLGNGARGPGRPALTRIPTSRPPANRPFPDGPVELEAPAGTPGLDDEDFPGALRDEDSEPGVFRPRRPLAPAADPRDQHQQADDDGARDARPGGPSPSGTGPAPLPRRRTPKLVSSHGRTVAHGTREEAAQDPENRGGPHGEAASRAPGAGPAALPRRVRQASLAPQLKDTRGSAADDRGQDAAPDTERDAEQVRSRMASLQRGWQRGRDENAGPTAPRTTPEGDGR